MKTVLRYLGKRISSLRNKKGITQERLAELVDYSPNHISKIESARTNPSLELLYQIAKTLNVELKDLFNFDEFKEQEFLQKELKNIAQKGNKETLKLLYKFYKSIEN